MNETPAPPPTEVVTDLVFDFLGMAKPLVHLIREDDTFEDRGDHYYIRWNDVGEDALVFKAQLLQFGRRVRLVQKVEQTAVQQVIADIKKKEAVAQGAVGRASQGAQGPTPAPSIPLPGVGASVPSDLWARSPITR